MTQPDIMPGQGQPGPEEKKMQIESPAEKAKRLIAEARVVVERQKDESQEDYYGQYEELYRERETLEAERDELIETMKETNSAVREFDAIEESQRTEEINDYIAELSKTASELSVKISDIESRIQDIDADPVFKEVSTDRDNEENERLAIEREQRKKEEREKNVEQLNQWIEELNITLQERIALIERLIIEFDGVTRDIRVERGSIKKYNEEKLELSPEVDRIIQSVNGHWKELKQGIKNKIVEAVKRSPSRSSKLDGVSGGDISNGINYDIFDDWFRSWIDEVQPSFIFPNKDLVALRELAQRTEPGKYALALSKQEESVTRHNELVKKEEALAERIKKIFSGDEGREVFEKTTQLAGVIDSRLTWLNPSEGESKAIRKGEMNSLHDAISRIIDLREANPTLASNGSFRSNANRENLQTLQSTIDAFKKR